MLHQRVVARISTQERQAGDGDRFAVADILVGEVPGGGAGEADHVAAKWRDTGSAAKCISGGRVVDLVVRGETRDGDIGRCDVGSEARLFHQRVVTRISTGERQAGDGNRLAVADILVGEVASSRTGEAYHIAAKWRDAGAAAECISGGRIVDLVG